ncbi:MAG: Asp-tRNA(Asn)/Glu-tRNA(Gln) amidotransferase subunit GatC [Deltaproteobacteria bacterium]|nr:Asp-tRNA(Asn)/Glu-tRNA(Gln) amidotransferase subunit GatC [Deltaproteobacteria bacterium]MBI3017392.1 Asp-tRNA(Asn)/Glu-tRNA(Gln) amidotransferase subunit GatC [Deltaproteobacteria bacterium]
MHITKQLVEHLAKLSLLELSPEEVERYTQELDSLMGYFEKLNRLDTAHIDPTFHVEPPTNVFREDEVRESFKREDLLPVFPAQEDGAIKVPKIIEAS